EIGTTAETQAARTIAERGVQLIATAHGNTLENLLQNPTLSDLVGGIQPVTLSDEEARRRGTQKTVLERKAPPTFDVLIEIQDKDRLAVHHDVAEVVDRLLRDIPPRPEIRVRTDGGEVEIHEPDQSSMPPAPAPARATAPRKRKSKDARDIQNPWEMREARTAREAAREVREAPYPVQHARPPKGKAVRVFPYAVSKSKLERAIRKFRLPLLIMDDLDEAEMVITLKAQERRQPRRLRDAEARGVPVFIIKSNTIAQMENFLRAHFGAEEPGADDEAALREVEEAVDEVRGQGRPVELAPQGSYLRRLQHQLVERFGLASESRGDEPYRRVVIYPS
ncbi:MAG TPA: R3H domain-containing nucleic acid-binding protein, partial [Thermoanaerobaculia bacterium]|nr:R3H domain-containing nucleic acid-binding protein [Thermoanaerobaculia bacterium]